MHGGGTPSHAPCHGDRHRQDETGHCSSVPGPISEAVSAYLLRGGPQCAWKPDHGEFSTTKVVSGKTFAEIFGLKGLTEVMPDLETKVHICTIQGLVAVYSTPPILPRRHPSISTT